MKFGKRTITEKEKLKIFLVVVLICFCLFIVINVRAYVKNRGVGFPDTYLFAAFDTSDVVRKNNSTLIYYDEYFREVFRQDIPVSDICNSTSPPIICGDKVYVAPYGDGAWFKPDEVLEIDRMTGKQKKYKTGQDFVWSMAVTEDYIFTVSNSEDAVLARTNKKDGSIQEVAYKNGWSSQLNVYGQYLYWFVEDEDGHSWCIILDIDTMAEIKSVDFTDYGKMPNPGYGELPNDTYMKDGILYMPIHYDSEDEECGHLLMYNTETDELESVDLGHGLPCQILEYEGKLVVTHTNYFLEPYASGFDEQSVSIYDPETGHLENYGTISALDQVIIKDGLLYALDRKEQSIFIYDMDSSGEELELKGCCELKSKGRFYYSGGFFMR